MALNLSTFAGIRVSNAATASAMLPLPSRLAALNALPVVTTFGDIWSDHESRKKFTAEVATTYHIVEDQ